MNIKDKKIPLLIINMFFINKVGIIYNKLISYIVYTLTIMAHDYLTYHLHFKDILLLVEFVME
jgi:hypothetical protein